MEAGLLIHRNIKSPERCVKFERIPSLSSKGSSTPSKILFYYRSSTWVARFGRIKKRKMSNNHSYAGASGLVSYHGPRFLKQYNSPQLTPTTIFWCQVSRYAWSFDAALFQRYGDSALECSCQLWRRDAGVEIRRFSQLKKYKITLFVWRRLSL